MTIAKGSVLRVNVERVVDGDTVRVKRAGFWAWLFPGPTIVVRLYGIDAPEREQPYGAAAAHALQQRLRGGGLHMETMATDRYGRTVGLLYYSDRNRSVNWELVRAGWAHAYVNYGGRELGMVAAERQARLARVGIWRQRRAPMRPADWRQRRGRPLGWGRRGSQGLSLAALGGLLLALLFVGLLVVVLISGLD